MNRRADTAYHRQNATNGCGAAVAMMILSDEQVGIGIQDLHQDRLFDFASMNPQVSGWAIHPDGLLSVLNRRFPGGFDVSRKKKIGVALGAIASALEVSRVGPAVLLNGGEHWVVVDEMVVAPGTGELVYVRIHDPWTSNGTPPDPHELGDTCRATGYADKEYSAQEWLRTFVECQCRRDSQAFEFLSIIARFSRAEISLDILRPEHPSGGAGIVDQDWLHGQFFHIVSRFGMEESLPAGINPAVPRLVHKLGERRRFYYLVSFLRHGQVVGAASFDAVTGDLGSIQKLDSEANADELLGIPKLRDEGRDGVLDYLADVLDGLAEVLGVSLGPGDLRQAATVSETPVWEPCSQSRSEYLPFWVVTVLGERIFIRLDGAIFRELTPGLLGA